MRKTPNVRRVEYEPCDPPVRHPKFVDLTGIVFADLTVLRFLGRSKARKSVWICRCVCGVEIPVVGAKLPDGHTTSCGCRVRELHSTVGGISTGRFYAVWKAMRHRCNLPSNNAYRNYGGRGIRVCARWDSSFLDFKEDMWPTYSPGKELDRIDNNGNYCPENCRWTDRKTQCRNMRKNRRVYRGMCVSELSEMSGVPETTIRNWVRKGHDIKSRLEARCANID